MTRTGLIAQQQKATAAKPAKLHCRIGIHTVEGENQLQTIL